MQRRLDRDSPGTPESEPQQRDDVVVRRVGARRRRHADLRRAAARRRPAKTATVPNKYGWQAGWDGAGEIGAARVTWNAEYTWMSRWTYSSFFGRTYEAQGRPIGWFAGLAAAAPARPPTRARRAVARSSPRARAARREELDDAIAPGDAPSPASLGRRRTRTRARGRLRWWPATGVDVSVRAGRAWPRERGARHGRRRRALARNVRRLRLVRVLDVARPRATATRTLSPHSRRERAPHPAAGALSLRRSSPRGSPRLAVLPSPGRRPMNSSDFSFPPRSRSRRAARRSPRTRQPRPRHSARELRPPALPCRDFDQFANGSWKRTAVIPPRTRRGRVRDPRREQPDQRARAARGHGRKAERKPGTPERMLGDYRRVHGLGGSRARA